MVSSVLQTRRVIESHTANNLSDILLTSFDEWGLSDKIITANTDNAKNIINAWKIINKVSIGCMGHNLNLAARKALDISSVSQVVGRVKRLVSHFHYSTQSSNMLAAKQALLKLPKRKLVQDVDTRWNSTYDMIQSVLEQQLPISAVLMEGPSKLKDLSLESKHVTLLESLVDILLPLKEVTVQLSGSSYCTISIIAPTMHQLINKNYQDNAADTKFVSELKKAISKDLKSRYQQEDVKQFLLISSVCDPRFRGLSFVSPDERCEIYNAFKDEMCNLKDGGLQGLEPEIPSGPLLLEVKQEIVKREDIGDDFDVINDTDLLNNLPSTSGQSNLSDKGTSQTLSLPANNVPEEPPKKRKDPFLTLGILSLPAVRILLMNHWQQRQAKSLTGTFITPLKQKI